jgi:replicative DNA helicase
MKTLTDESSEAALLSLCFFDPALLDRRQWTPALFTGAYRALAKVLAQLRAKPAPITPANVKLTCKDDALSELAAKLATRPLGGSFELLCERLREIRVRAKMAEVCRAGHDAAFDEAQDFRAILENFETQAMTIRGLKSGTLQDGADYAEIMELIQWRQNNVGKIRGIKTGFARLDSIIDGLLPNYYIIGARTSVGKTSWALCLVASLLSDGRRVLFFAGENAEQIKERLLSIIARVPVGRMDRAYTPEELKMLSRAMAEIAAFDWVLDTTSNPSIAHIQSVARRVHREKPVDLIVGDYIQLFKGVAARKDDKRAQIDEISKCFKAMAKELHVAILVLSQLRRPEGNVFDKTTKQTEAPRPELHHLKEAGALEEDADFVGLLHRDQKNNSSHAELIVAKNKNGETGETIPLNFRGECFYFSER